MKYNNLKELAKAKKNGELEDSFGSGIVVIDNDKIDVHVDENCVFTMHPREALTEALSILGLESDSA